MMAGYLYVAQRQRTLGVLSLGAAIVNVGLNVWLLPWVGVVGAAWATLASFVLLAVATTWVALRAQPMPWSLRDPG